MKWHRSLILHLILLTLLLPACQPATVTGSIIGSTPTAADATFPPAVVQISTTRPTVPPPAAAAPTATAVQPPASPTPWPSPTASTTPSATPTATATATATPIGPCRSRVPADDLLILVSHDYGLGRDYVPADLVPLADYLPPAVTLGYPTEVRAVIVEPLLQMISDMQAAGLAPTVISGYRSYYSQSIAWDKWHARYPDWANRISMPPGHSEHQLGTTIDFGSPELAEIIGEEDVEFHTYFYKTSEGKWLADHAHEYGFILSYPANSYELTQFFYEPWHFRYVGVELAGELKETGLTLLELQNQTQPAPCIPEDSR